jgi:hypothetical protein
MRSFDRDEVRRSTVVPRSDAYGAFGSSLLLLPGGKLLLSFGRIDFGRGVNQKALATSDDRGWTWSGPRIIEELEGVPKTLRAESLSLLGDGRIAMVGVVAGPEGVGTGFVLRFSHDGGETWTDPVTADGKGTVPWSNRIVETAAGDLLVTARAPWEPGITRKVVMQNRSRDGGTTWEGPRVVASDPVLKLTEPSTIWLSDGRLMTAIRETSYNFYPSYRIFSEDDGETWTRPEEMPMIGHEMCLGQLGSGRVMVAYRHVGGYAATFLWAGEPDEAPGFCVPATVRGGQPPRIVDDYLRLKTEGVGEAALYHLHPPESSESTIDIQAELRCITNRENGCGIHVAQAGWISFLPDRVELPDCGEDSAPIDGTDFRRYSIRRDAETLSVDADGENLLRTRNLNRGRSVEVDYGTIHTGNVNSFGTQTPFMGDSGSESRGESHWRSLRIDIGNPNHPDHSWRWTASSGLLPNSYEDERMIEVENDYGGSPYFLGQTSWVQFPDGEIFVVTGRQYLREDGRRSSWLRGCHLREEDLPGPRGSDGV